MTTTEYEIKILNSPKASAKGAPSTASLVAFITVNRRGSNIGNDKTGYKVPFVLAFAMIAAIIVEAPANPILPSKMVIKNIA